MLGLEGAQLVGTAFLVAALLAATPGAPTAPSRGASEVARVRALFDAISTATRDGLDPNSPLLRDSFVRALASSCESAAADVGLTAPGPEELENLREAIRDSVRVRLTAIPFQPATARREALEAYAREVTSRSAAMAVLEAWLGLSGLPPIGAVVADGRAHRAASPVTTEAQADNPFALQLGVAADGAGELAVDVPGSRVIGELGGAGAGNGLIDNGEWVELSLGLVNRSTHPWFSTSAFFESTGNCIWTDTARNVVAPEIPPGGKGAVRGWIYVASECADPSERTLRVRFRDSRRGVSGLQLMVTISPLELPWPQLANVRLDTDHYGSSDGSATLELGPDLAFEFSTDVRLPSSAVQQVSTSFNAPADLKGLFKNFDYSDRPLLSHPDGTFEASDDVDATLVGAGAFRRTVLAAKKSKPWVANGKRGSLWLAIDVLVQVPRPAPAPQTVEEDQPHRGIRRPQSVATEAAPEAQRVAPPPGPVILELLRRHLALVPHRVTPAQPNAVDAASGMEMLLDSEGFLREYALLIAPTPVPPAPERVPLKYRFRTYYALPMLAVLPAKEELPMPPPPPRPEPPHVAMLRFDAFGDVQYYSVSRLPTRPLVWSGDSALGIPGGGVRAWYGHDWVGFATVDLRHFEGVQTDQRSSFVTELSGALGGGYLFTVGSFELTPWAAVGLRMRQTTGTIETLWLPQVEVGGTARWMFTQRLGAFIEGSYRIGQGGPAATTTTEVMDGSGPRWGLGLTLRL